MILTVDPEASATLTISSGDIPCLVTEIPMSEDAAGTPGTFYDALTLTNESATVWTEYEITSPLSSPPTLENQSPGILSISGTRVSKAASGIGFVNATVGSTSRSIECDVTTTGGQSFVVFDGYDNSTVSKALFDAVVALLDTEKQTAYFTTQNHVAASYVRNPNCWLDVDLECIAVASKAPGGEWTRQGAPILIAPQVVAMCNHFARSVNSEVRFADAAGNIVTRTITGLATANATTGDAMIGVLDSPVTGINPCAVVGGWIEQDPTDIGGGRRSSYVGGAGFYLDQFGAAHACMFGEASLSYGYGASGTYQGETLTNVATEIPVFHDLSFIGAEFSSFAKTPVTYDSGSFVGVIIDGAPVLFLTWHYPNSGTPFFDERLALMVESAKSNAGISGSITHPVVAPDPTL